MYKAKSFYVRPAEDVIADLEEMSGVYTAVRRIFLADGDALAADTEYLTGIVRKCYSLFPKCERVTSYATPRSIIRKSAEELKAIRESGLTMLYMGLESGNDEVLKMMHKGNTAAQITDAGIKARSCGFELSVTAITGLGGTGLMREHAADTGRVLSRMNPEYIGLLTLMVSPGTLLEKMIADGSFVLPETDELLEEIQLTVENIDSPGSIFRMNHASNYLILRGTFNKDKDRLLREIEAARQHRIELRPEYFRGL